MSKSRKKSENIGQQVKHIFSLQSPQGGHWSKNDNVDQTCAFQNKITEFHRD